MWFIAVIIDSPIARNMLRRELSSMVNFECREAALRKRCILSFLAAARKFLHGEASHFINGRLTALEQKLLRIAKYSIMKPELLIKKSNVLAIVRMVRNYQYLR